MKPMARLIKVDGEEQFVRPEDHESFTVEELQELIGCRYLDFTALADGRRMAVDTDFSAQAINIKASVLFQEGRNSGLAMRGNVVVGTKQEIR